jgi:hypothetical protein
MTSDQTGLDVKQQLVEQQLLQQLAMLMLATVVQAEYRRNGGSTAVPDAAAASEAALPQYAGEYCSEDFQGQQQQQRVRHGIAAKSHEQLLLSLGVPLGVREAVVHAPAGSAAAHSAVQHACKALGEVICADVSARLVQQDSSSSSASASSSSSNTCSTCGPSSSTSGSFLLGSDQLLPLVGTVLELLLLQCQHADGGTHTAVTLSCVMSLLAKMVSADATTAAAAACAPAAAASLLQGQAAPVTTGAAAALPAARSTARGMHVLVGAALRVQQALNCATRQLAAVLPVSDQPKHDLLLVEARMKGSFDNLVWMLAAAAGQAAGEPAALVDAA